TIIDNIPELIFYKDKELKYRILNKEAKKFYEKIGVKNVIGKTDLELPIGDEFANTCREHDEIVLKTRKHINIDEKVPIPGSNEYQIFKTIKTPIISDDGDVNGLVGVVRDITQQKKLEEKL
ncbi:MAG: PAS domain-containing protein, partial [Peptostreptococcaceae bacterium]